MVQHRIIILCILLPAACSFYTVYNSNTVKQDNIHSFHLYKRLRDNWMRHPECITGVRKPGPLAQEIAMRRALDMRDSLDMKHIPRIPPWAFMCILAAEETSAQCSQTTCDPPNHDNLTLSVLDQTINQLIQSPQHFADQNDNMCKCLEGASNIKQDINNMIQHKNPLFCFRECNESQCPISRNNAPRLRDQYDHIVCRHMINASQCADTTTKQIDYVSVGSGYLLQELRTLLLALREKPDMAIRIHLIDPNTCDNKQKTSDDVHSAMQPNAIRPQSRPNDTCINSQAQPEYAIHILQTKFPKAKITRYTYNDIESYATQVEGVESHQVNTKGSSIFSKPDVITMNDMEPADFKDMLSKVVELLSDTSLNHAIILHKIQCNMGTQLTNSHIFEISRKPPQRTKTGYAFDNIVRIIKQLSLLPFEPLKKRNITSKKTETTPLPSFHGFINPYMG